MLKELVKNAIIEAVKKNLEMYFSFESYQTDVSDYYFRFDGVKLYESDFMPKVNGKYAIVKAWWDDAELNSDLDFKLIGVDVHVFEYDEDDNEIKTEFTYEEIKS